MVVRIVLDGVIIWMYGNHWLFIYVQWNSSNPIL